MRLAQTWLISCFIKGTVNRSLLNRDQQDQKTKPTCTIKPSLTARWKLFIQFQSSTLRNPFRIVANNCCKSIWALLKLAPISAMGFQLLWSILFFFFRDLKEAKVLLDTTTSEEKCVIHFYHADFRRCAIMDTHLEVSSTALKCFLIPTRFGHHSWCSRRYHLNKCLTLFFFRNYLRSTSIQSLPRLT